MLPIISNMKLFMIVVSYIFLACEKSAFDAWAPLLDDDTPSLLTSTMDLSIPAIADGVSSVTIVISLKNAAAKPLVGKVVSLSVSGTGNIISACPMTDSLGATRCYLRSTWAEQKMVTAVSKIKMSKQVVFTTSSGALGLAGIVTSGGTHQSASGHKVTSTSGIVETPSSLKDSLNVKRLNTSLRSYLGDN